MVKDRSQSRPAKSLKIKSKRAANTFKIEKNKHFLSPSVSEISKNLKKPSGIAFKINSNKKKKRKRTNSANSFNQTAVITKKKKKINVKKYSRLVFNEFTNSSEDEEYLYDATTSKEYDDLCQLPDSSFNSEDSDIDTLDTKIEGLKLQDIFRPATSKHFSESHVLNIPKKHFKIHQNDLDPDFKIYEDQSENELCVQTESFDHTHSDSNINRAASNFELQQTIVDIDTENVPENINYIPENIDYLPENIYYTTENIENDTTYASENPTDFIVNICLKNNDILLVINTFEKVYFYGLCTIQVLQGEIEIMGATLKNSSGVKKLYSPRGSALLYLQNNTKTQETSLRDIKHFVSEDLLFEEDRTISINASAAVTLCKNLDEPFMNFIEKHTSQVLFPTVDNQGPRIIFGPTEGWNYVKTHVSWNEVTDNFSKSSKLVICGGKGVGKSTFLRYCINRILEKFEKVRVVDLDPGQTEFTVPGCISIVNVTEQIFGSNYTHHVPFERSILCNINVGYDIHQYLKSVETLLTFLNAEEDLPTLYNLCGYHKGLGLDMTMTVISLIKPTKLVQIMSFSRNKNYSFDLDAPNLRKNLSNCDKELNYEFFSLKSEAEGQKSNCWNMEARFSREVNILAYLGKLMSENISDLTSSQVSMYSINLSYLKIKDSEGNTISPLAINANLVALCSLLEAKSEFLCHGWGFVRGIDPEKDMLVLITPENLETLNQVTHLVLTTNSVVPSLLMTTGGVQGHVPYLAERHQLSNFAQLTKRSYLPPKSNW